MHGAQELMRNTRGSTGWREQSTKEPRHVNVLLVSCLVPRCLTEKGKMNGPAACDRVSIGTHTARHNETLSLDDGEPLLSSLLTSAHEHSVQISDARLLEIEQRKFPAAYGYGIKRLRALHG